MKKVIIEDRAKIINFRNRKVRTPVTLKIADDEVKNIKLQMRMSDIHKWRIEEVEEKEIEDTFFEEKDVVIEELVLEPRKILDKLVDGECEL